MNKKGCELCPPARGFLQGLVHEADPGVSRAMKPDMDLGVFAQAAVFFGQVSRDMRFARIMTSGKTRKSLNPQFNTIPRPSSHSNMYTKHHKKRLTTNHHIIINNSNSIPVQKHMHKFQHRSLQQETAPKLSQPRQCEKIMFTILKKQMME